MLGYSIRRTTQKMPQIHENCFSLYLNVCIRLTSSRVKVGHAIAFPSESKSKFQSNYILSGDTWYIKRSFLKMLRIDSHPLQVLSRTQSSTSPSLISAYKFLHIQPCDPLSCEGPTNQLACISHHPIADKHLILLPPSTQQPWATFESRLIHFIPPTPPLNVVESQVPTKNQRNFSSRWVPVRRNIIIST